ncbi:NUDIX domain-containing protein [Heyndrickxia sporothermodurans]|uniref:NUDIX domain-containing protein n=1 Tax=Heyndrickxia sporothermodurans TaxID=46224 RepID=UPI002E1B661B|nr:NUDIX domain-containing protein [Heyndrickxia sporothermodurans]MED3651746.1 NUDIX domain-containing protein [Heyndrickxia sporothermodurans]MED3697081.1 NUDIX domain-containing protein [Heyndrickxia sporothermodurans]
MINCQQNIKTSGAYVLYRGMFAFQVGPTKNGDKLGVVRLGGHREKDETALETAKREVYEEASIYITPVSSPITYYKNEWNDRHTTIQVKDKIAPILIKGNVKKSLSIMYLSHSDIEPKPSSESNGILLLTPEDVHLICHEKITLKEFISQNGTSILKNTINKDLLLHPFPQLVFLSRLLKEQPNFINTWVF